MTNAQLIKELSTRAYLDEANVQKLLEELVDLIARNMANGEKTNVLGLGVFHLGKRASCYVVEPRSGKRIKVPAMAMPGIRFGSNFKRRFR